MKILLWSHPRDTALEQYWAERRRICEEAVGRLQQPFRKTMPSARGSISARQDGVPQRLLKRCVAELALRCANCGLELRLIREAKRTFLRDARVEVWIPLRTTNCGSCARPEETETLILSILLILMERSSNWARPLLL